MLAAQAYHTAFRISYRDSDISLEIAAFYDIIRKKEGAFMSVNILLDLSFDFAVAVVNLVDSVTALKSSYMTDQLVRSRYFRRREYTRSAVRAEQERFYRKVGNCIERVQRDKLLAETDVRNQKN